MDELNISQKLDFYSVKPYLPKSFLILIKELILSLFIDEFAENYEWISEETMLNRFCEAMRTELKESESLKINEVNAARCKYNQSKELYL